MTQVERLRTILRDLLRDYDEERQAINVYPDAGCSQCTLGTTPNNLNTGPCVYHRAVAALGGDNAE